MAGIQVGQGHGRRPVDHEIPLVPFIDLLLCCVMFLLVTAVWNRLAAVTSSVERPGDPHATSAMDTPTLRIAVHADSVELSSEAGERVSLLRDDQMTALREALRGRTTDQDVDVVPDDGLAYAEVIGVMDAVIGEGFVRVSVVD